MGCFRWLCRIPLSCRRAVRHPEFCFTDQNCLFYYLDLIFRRFLGRFLVFFIYALISFMTFVVGAIILPHESLHKPQWFIVVLLAFACYLIFNIIYHYYKASTTPPGSPPKSNEAPQCYRCHNHKPEGAHHCGICDKCILDMDHHCIWANTCIGAKNHRHFLQFIGFLTVGCLTFVSAGFPTFYDNYWRPSKDTVFCHVDLSAWPWHKSICADGGEFVMACIFFCYFLCAIVVLLVGGLFWWNFVLISTGKTYIDFLQDERPSGLIWRLIWPFANHGFVQHWKRFLGLNRKRTFLSHILLPSSHPSGRYAFDDEPLLSTTTVL